MISVIIPAYNSELFIEKCLKSVVSQSFKLFEVILIDDGSTDTTVNIATKILKNTDHRIIKQSNKGPSEARNIGVKYSKYDWIAFLDADDYWLPNKLELQFKEALAKKADLVGCNLMQKDMVKTSIIEEISFKKLLMYNFFVTSTVLMSKNIFFTCKGFDISMRHSEDYDLWLKVAAKGHKMIVLNKKLVYHDFNSNHERLSSSYKRMYDGELKSYTNAYLRGEISKILFWILKFKNRINKLRKKIITKLLK